MFSSRLALRAIRNGSLFQPVAKRSVSSSSFRLVDNRDRVHSNAEEHRDYQKNKPENPHMTNTTSTFHNDVPSVGEDKAPPELISSVDPDYLPKDKRPENTERMTGGTQAGDPDKVSQSELAVGEMEGAQFKVEPIRRLGEDTPTTRSRLLCPYPLVEDFLTLSIVQNPANASRYRPNQETGYLRVRFAPLLFRGCKPSEDDQGPARTI